jgi:hypothetical protein
MAELHPAEDLILDLALGGVSEPERAHLAHHLAVCPACRSRYDEISDTIEQTLAAAPTVEPRPGFERGVLAAMGMDGEAVSGRTEGARPGPRRRWLLAAAAAVVAVLVGIGVVVATTGTDEPTRQSALAPGASYLSTQDGDRVGTVTPSRFDGQPVLVVAVTAGQIGKRYACVLLMADGSRRPAGDWVLEESPAATWVVPAPDDDVAAVELVTDAGTVWSSAPL